ncbi:hypothetical protein B0H13DRAFT_1868584 [Mycena leptocephala]|nr:hypothetical protein B0H13DRAFT_1868584 [Mycena leptocephala]
MSIIPHFSLFIFRHLLKEMQSFNLPIELWFEIFRNLPRSALRNVHAVSCLFHDISHPLFFRNFTLDPDRHYSPDEFAQRLDTYSSALIANHVRKLTVSFQFGRWFRARTRWGRFFTGSNSPSPLVVPLLQSIPKFHNLRVLECLFRFDSEVHFADLGFQALPHLDELRIHGGALHCPRTPSPTASDAKIRVTHFSFTAIPGIRLERRRETPRSFLSMLDPETLCSLTLAPSYDCSPAAWLAYDADIFCTFRKLSTVSIGCDGPFLRDVHAFLAALPALRNLMLSGAYRRYTEFAPAPGVCLSRGLESYTGPCEYIPVFLPGTACARLSINGCCTPQELCNVLEETPCTHAVTDLSLHFSLAGVCSWTDPRGLFALFPRLNTLRVRISDAPLDDDDSDVFDAAETFDPAELFTLPEIFCAVLRAAGTLSQAAIEWGLAFDTVCMLPDLQDLHDLWVREAPRVERIIFEVDVRADCSDGSEFADSGDSIEEGGMQE